MMPKSEQAQARKAIEQAGKVASVTLGEHTIELQSDGSLLVNGSIRIG